MIIVRVSAISGIVRELDLPITREQYESWENGVLAQIAFPTLTADQREFIMSGATKEEWDSIFGEEEGLGEQHDGR